MNYYEMGIETGVIASGKLSEDRVEETVKSRRNKVYIVWIRIQLAYLSRHTGAVGLYTQFKELSTSTWPTVILPGYV